MTFNDGICPNESEIQPRGKSLLPQRTLRQGGKAIGKVSNSWDPVLLDLSDEMKE